MNRRFAGRIVMAVLLCAVVSLFGMTMASAQAGGKPPAGKGGPGGKQPSEAEKKKMEKMQQDMMADMQERLKHRFTPVIKKVTAGPAKVGQPINITVKAAYDDKRAIDKIDEVRVYYSSDGGQKWGKPVKLKKAGADWKGQIPKQKEKGTLTYYIWIKDTRGNVTSELPCAVTTWPPLNDNCMVKGAADKEPVDDKASEIENNLDIWEFKVGMDQNYVYLQQSVEGTVKEGTMSPTHINGYFALLADLGIIKEVDDIMTLMNNQDAAEKKFKGKENLFWLMIYSPLLKAMWPDAKKCFMPRPSKNKPKEGQPAMPEMDTKNITCAAKGPDLFFRVNKAVLPASMKNSVAIIGALTMAMTEQSFTGLKFGDMLNVTRAVWSPRTLKVN